MGRVILCIAGWWLVGGDLRDDKDPWCLLLANAT